MIRKDAPLFSWLLIFWSVLQGALVFAFTGGIFILALRRGMPADEVRALTFVALVFCVASLVLVNRSFSSSLVVAIRRPNPALAWIFGAVAVVLALGLLQPSVRSLFSFGPLHGDNIGLVLVAAATVLIVLELAKTTWRDRLRF